MQWWKRRGTHDADAPDAAAMRDERLSAYLDGELSASERAALEVELATDASMRDALEGMRAVQIALTGLGEVRAPRAFTLNADTLSAAAIRTPRGASRLEWVTRLGAVASAAACALLLTTAGGVGEFSAAGSSMSQTTAERSMAPLAAAPQPAADAAGATSSGPTGLPSTANAGATESTRDSAVPPASPQAPASNPLRASTPDTKSAGGAGGGIVAPASTAPAGAALASAPAAPASSATPSAGAASSGVAASAPAAASPTPGAAIASAPSAPTTTAQGGIAAATPLAAAPPVVTPAAVGTAQAAPSAAPSTSTPALGARPAAPEVTRTTAAAPQPNEVTTYGTERDGTTSQLEEPSSVGRATTSTGTFAAVLAGLTAVLSVTAIGQWVARRRG